MRWNDTFAGFPAPSLNGAGNQRHIGVAIAIPDPYGSDLQNWRRRLGDPGSETILPHVTLLPPTELHGDDLPIIEEHLSAVAAAGRSFRIVLAGSGTFRPISPVVFVVVAQGAPECTELERSVRQGPLTRVLQFPYHPHVTVAHDRPADTLDLAENALSDYHAEFEVWGFSLFERGPDHVWRPQRDFPFGRELPGPDRPGEMVGDVGGVRG